MAKVSFSGQAALKQKPNRVVGNKGFGGAHHTKTRREQPQNVSFAALLLLPLASVYKFCSVVSLLPLFFTAFLTIFVFLFVSGPLACVSYLKIYILCLGIFVFFMSKFVSRFVSNSGSLSPLLPSFS